MKFLQAFLRDTRGGPAAEFALVLPFALMFMFGIIDVGRFMWAYNQAEKATQMGARFAVTTDPVASGLSSYSFAVSCGIPQGDPITAAQFPGVNCTGGGTVAAPTASCALAAATSCATTIPVTASADAMAGIVQRIQAFKPDVEPADVTVNYGYSGLGYAGDPNGIDAAPLVTVSINGLTFKALTAMPFNYSMPMSPFSYSLTMEDGAGTVAN